MLVLSERDLIGLLPPLELLATVEAALNADDRGHVVAPKRMHVSWDTNTLLTMPAVAEGGSGAQGGIGIKIISVVPGNAARGWPVTNGLMVLNDVHSGLPLAVMNAAALTAQRTGAVGALGVKYLTRSTINSVGIVGCGVQAAWQAVFACALRPITEVCVYSRSMSGLKQFTRIVTVHAPSARIITCRSAHELLERSHLIITATTSCIPVLPDEPDRLIGKHFISVGSYRPNMQELPDSVYRLAGLLAVDSAHARQEVGDVMKPLQNGLLTERDVFPIADCVMARRIVDTSRTTAYKSVGAAVYDLFVALALYRAAKSKGVGTEVDL